jgi:hypothetical protein
MDDYEFRVSHFIIASQLVVSPSIQFIVVGFTGAFS